MIRNLTPQSNVVDAYVANDINDLGQIVGSFTSCDTNPCGNVVHGWIPPGNAVDPWAALADPTSPVGLPSLSYSCGPPTVGEFARLVSNNGYVAGSNSLSSPLGSEFGIVQGPMTCGTHVLELFENGVAVTPLGFLYDPVVGFLEGDEYDARIWVIDK
jgi:hypothetical protein